MKRFLATLICVTLLCGTVLAEPAPSKAVITIDNIRVAFYSPDGTYLSPLEVDGAVWVPAESLGESLGMAVTADPDNLAVIVEGVRIALFDENGDVLDPMLIDGVVYVPLQAFAESTGIQLKAEGGTYALRRGTSQDAPQSTQEPPAEVWVDLNSDNFSNYFSVTSTIGNLYRYEEDYTLGSQKFPFQYWTVTVAITCTARYNYEFQNVNFSVTVPSSDFVSQYAGGKSVSFSNLTMPPSGELSRSENVTCSYVSHTDILTSNTILFNAPTVYVRSGSICVPRNSMLSEWASQYSSAQDALKRGEFDKALDIFTALAVYGYEDAAEQARLVEQAREDDAESKRRQAYDQALEDLGNGRFDEAIEAFAALAEEEYGDSDAQREEAIRQRDDDQYRQANDAMEQEAYQEAIDLLTPLAAKGYEGSVDLLDAARTGLENQRFQIYDADYQKALELEVGHDFAGAIEAFRPLANIAYEDSEQHLAANEAAQGYLEEQAAAYQAGIDAEGEKQWDTALNSFLTCLDYSNARAHAAVCMLNSGSNWILPPRHGGYYFIWVGDNGASKAGYGNVNTGEFRFLEDMSIYTSRNDEALWRQGLCVVTCNELKGAMNAGGELVLACEWDDISFRDGCLLARKGDEVTLMDASGKPVEEGTFTLLSGNENNAYSDTGIYGNVNLFPACYARMGSADRQLITYDDGRILSTEQPGNLILSNDGLLYTVLSRDGQEVLLDPEGNEVFSAERIYNDMTDLSTWECWHMYDGVIAFREGEKWGLWDTVKNRQLVKPTLETVYPFTEGGVARFMKKGKYGVIRSNGKELISAKYENMDPFYDERARVYKDTKKKIDGQKKDVTLYGFVSEKGKEIIPMKYIKAGDFRQGFGLTWVAVEDGVLSGNHRMTKFSFHVMNKDGKPVFSIKDDISYTNARDCGLWFQDVYQMAELSYIGTTELFNSKGEFLDRFKKIWRLGDSLIATMFHTKEYGGYGYSIFNRNGEEIQSFARQSKEMTFYALSTDDGYLLYCQYAGGSNGKFMLIDANGKQWLARVPKAHPEPTEAEIGQAASHAGIM